MATQTGDNQKDIVKDAVKQFVDASMYGEKPDIDEFAKQYPGLESHIRRGIQELHKINNLFDSLVQADASDFEDITDEHELVGKRIGNFEITEMIGRGGMGVVYLAHDTKLKRSVAIKSMPAKLAADPKAKMRFRREAELLASLNHPNIAVIHEIIEEQESGYLVLEFVSGETLTERIARESLTVEQALSIGGQIAEAISAAHKKGVVHRDLKPGNIKITPEGRVKVLDFGLAKVASADTQGHETTSTQHGHIVGTPAYMSPEQARGKGTDHRTDIWSFGCIMYQMLSGHLPFEGETATDILAHIIEREPDWKLLPDQTPENIRTLLQRCLEKDPDKRLADMTDITGQISDTLSRPLTAPVPAISPRLKRAVMIFTAIFFVALAAVGAWFALYKPTQPSPRNIRLVVLPFDNLGPAEEEWFADVMSREITDRLSGVDGLAVINRYSAIQCKERKMGTRQITRDLNVDYILDGTVQCDNPADSNSQVRLSLQLTDTASNTLIWRDSFDRVRGQMFELQSEIAEQVARKLDILLLEQDRTWSKYIPTTDNVEAYNLWLKGKDEEALKLDPKFARAHSGLAWVYTQMYFSGQDRSPERLAKADSAARTALKLAPDIPLIQVVMARVYYQGYRDYANALKHLDRALELQPSYALALYWKGAVQARQGNREEGLANTIRAFELNPLSDHFAFEVGNRCKILRKYPKAERYHELAIELNPTKPYYYPEKAWLYLVWHGDLPMARTVMEEGLSKGDPSGDWTIFNWLMVTINILDGQHLDALDHLSRGPQVSETSIWFIPNDLRRAEIYGYLGQNDLATQHYESALTSLKAKVQERPEDDRYQSSLGIAYAGLGNKDEAISHGEYGREMSRVADTVSALRMEDLARIYVMVGEHNKAIDMLEELLRIPSRLSHKLIALDPTWDPLHKEPRFQKLIESGK